MPRPPQPDDLARFRVATGPRLSPDGTLAAFTVQTSTAVRDEYRHAIWLVAADGSSPARQATLGARHDHSARFSPDGRTLAFISDRRLAIEDAPGAPKDREDASQVYLLRLDGGEARRLTDLPRGVDGFEWSPDGRRLVVSTTSFGPTREEDMRLRGMREPKPDEPRESDYRYIDRLGYQYNARGFIYDHRSHLWLVDAETGAARRLTDGEWGEGEPAWSPDGRFVAFSANRRRDHDLNQRSDIWIVDVETGEERKLTGGNDAVFFGPTWLPDARRVAALGGRFPHVYRTDIWLFAADGADAAPGGGTNLSGRHDIMPASTMGSDVTVGEDPRLVPSPDGRWLTFSAPIDGSYELWRIAVDGGELERLTTDRHYISSFDQAATGRIAFLRSTPTELPDLHVLDGRGATVRRVTELNADVLAELDLRTPVERRWSVEGRDIQGWLIPAGDGRQPLVTEIHGGPHTLYGWAPEWEFQVLAASGMSVFYSNPRGSEGYGLAFNEANLGDWGPGPTRDVLAGVDALVADGLADPDRLGVTGGSYGGYLTNWIVGHDQRFRAAMTLRCVADLNTLFLTGDISGGEWAKIEFGRLPWEDPEYFRQASPISYASRIRTPLLIQHAEQDMRTTIAQAESLFTILRSLRRPVRLMRVPEETHELTRSGSPFRRVEAMVQVRDWFAHFLVKGRRGLPALPKARGGK